ncbi:MAG: type II toxin-antitoxin system RelE/ParE family toxin [Saprospiraceae bacterium]
MQQFPNAGRVVPETNIASIREIVIHRYRVIYHLAGAQDYVSILTIRHSAQPFLFIS